MEAVISMYFSSHADMWKLEMRKRACIFKTVYPKKEHVDNFSMEIGGVKVLITPLERGGFGAKITVFSRPKIYKDWDASLGVEVFEVGLHL